MPLNLNALIRYKCINNCLSSIRKFTIKELVERCSKAISEHKGIPTTVSERSIREDIKIMRSDILGFNAPIVQKDGFYYYGDRDYDLMNIFIKEEGLARKILLILYLNKEHIDDPNLEEVLLQLQELLGYADPIESEIDESAPDTLETVFSSDEYTINECRSMKESEPTIKHKKKPGKKPDFSKRKVEPKEESYSYDYQLDYSERKDKERKPLNLRMIYTLLKKII